MGSVGDAQYAVVGDGLESGRVTVDDGDLEVVAVAGADDIPPEVYVHPQGVLDGVERSIDVSVVRGSDEESVQSYVSTGVFFESYSAESIAWRGEEPIVYGGGTRYGEVLERDEGAVLRTFTDASGETEIRVDRDPDLFERAVHWVAVRVPIPGVVTGLAVVVPVGVVGRRMV